MTTALYIGRFQPLHKGHFEYMKKMLKEAEILKIVIGSSQEIGTARNPFSVDERKEMLKLCFNDEKIAPERIRIFSAEDCPESNELWLRNVLKLAGSSDIVYAGENKLVARIFRNAGYDVRTLKRRIAGISATKIRRMIAAGKGWKIYVPENVYDYVLKIKGDKRIKKL